LKKPIILAICILICLAAGFIGSIFTTSSIAGWYATIQKPSFNPPNWIFGPVWTTLYILMGVSIYLILQKKSKYGNTASSLFSIQLALNIFWSIIFFSFHSPFLAFIDIIILWFCILLTIIYFLKISKPASYLLIPYLLWVSFASVLNFYIMVLN
jgi:translocator protein